jgi:hypothetical protein
MPRWGWLALAVVAGLVVAYGFAFTLPGLISELVAAIALLALITRAVLALVRRPSAHTGR